MEPVFITDKTFEHLNSSNDALTKGEYEHCVFSHCDLSNMDLSGFIFSECTFTGCNLSMAKLTKAALREVTFKDCKLLGLHFEHCNEFLFAVSFEKCILNLSIFYKLKLKKTLFKHCSLKEADFSETDLTQAVFTDCDFSGATFDQTILEKADLRTSYNYALDPENNRIRKAQFSMPAAIGLLAKYDVVIE